MLNHFKPIELADVIRPEIIAHASPQRVARLLMLRPLTHEAISTGWPVRITDEREARALGLYALRINADLVWQNQSINLQFPNPPWPRVAILEPKT